ncbi:MAG: GNAT family N-acetyltransferase [Candidatus Adiutrix sp.]|nr:GNAT family N-acetyltransferase [Candidatus Adiutrix sp.]
MTALDASHDRCGFDSGSPPLFQRQGLGGALLADAVTRARQAEIVSFAMVVEAKDKSGSAFYRHHGFIALPESSLSLFMPL